MTCHTIVFNELWCEKRNENYNVGMYCLKTKSISLRCDYYVLRLLRKYAYSFYEKNNLKKYFWQFKLLDLRLLDNSLKWEISKISIYSSSFLLKGISVYMKLRTWTWTRNLLSSFPLIWCPLKASDWEGCFIHH